MKLNFKLIVLLVCITLQVSFAMKKNTINSLLKSNSKQGPAPAPAPIRTQVAPPVVSASFWLHKFFTGKDPIRYLEESWKKPEKKYFVVNANSIYYGKNQLTNAIIEGKNSFLNFHLFSETIDLRDLYDREVDSAAEGRCCERLKYVEYPEVKMCDGSPCNKLYPGGKITNEQKDNDPFLARFCVLLYSYNIVNWRICHWNKNEIQRLRMNIITQVVKLEVPVIDPSVMQKILMNAKYSPLQEQESWSWMDQDKWEGNCQSQIMQSPIPIKVEPNAPSIQPRFMFSFSFANNIPYEVVKHKEEIRIVFTSKPNENGSLRMEFGTYELMVKNFFPYQIVFRFPAEHTLNDNRYDGEIVLQFIENIDNNDKVLINLNDRKWPYSTDLIGSYLLDSIRTLNSLKS